MVPGVRLPDPTSLRAFAVLVAGLVIRARLDGITRRQP
jgi:hypothetical protein